MKFSYFIERLCCVMVKLHNKPLLQNKELKVIKCEKTRSEKHRAEIENGREYRQII